MHKQTAQDLKRLKQQSKISKSFSSITLAVFQIPNKEKWKDHKYFQVRLIWPQKNLAANSTYFCGQ